MNNILTAVQRTALVFLSSSSDSNSCPLFGASLRPYAVSGPDLQPCAFIDGTELRLTNEIKLVFLSRTTKRAHWLYIRDRQSHR